MSHLSLSLLGPFQAVLEGRPVVGFRSDKARALLIYLAAEGNRPHAREALAGLLWPDYPNATSLTYLRSALANLRHLLDMPTAGLSPASSLFLLVTRDTVQFNPAADASLDIIALTRLLDGQPTLDALEQAVALCRGPFLEGFSISHAAPFDEWLLFKREQLNRQEMSALHRLTAAYMAERQFSQAEVYARRQLALDPWDEPAHQQLMASLALSGQASAALVQYETCRHVLARDLAVAPARETMRLRDRIQAGALEDVCPQTSDIVTVPSPFIARAHELAHLDAYLAHALAGNGRAIFVTGEAGSGKTTLMHEFARRALATQPGAVVASGRCSSLIGLDDPYLPFREIIQMLTGDIEVRRAGGGMTPEHAQQMWKAVPVAVQALVETAPGLIGSFVDGEALALRVEAVTTSGGHTTAGGWRTKLADRVRRQVEGQSTPNSVEQGVIFEQVTAFLRALARHHPLILLLDDLQWADNGSISLLFHLARYIAGSRILIVGAYRAEDVALGRDGGRHPLVAVLHEVQRAFGDTQLDLDQVAGQPFINALLDSEPNHLGEAFRDTFYRHTEGQPLFAVELLASLQESGGLVRNEAGQWTESATLDWETLPARVEAIIAERVDRLPLAQQALLRAASVEGEEFTAEVVAQIQGLAERDVVTQLTYTLSRDYRLVRSHSVQRVDGQRLSRYRFRHHLFWQYIYTRLDGPERTRLHEAVGTTLETLSASTEDQVTSRAPQLAWHFEQAGLLDKAVHYRHQAGDQAMRLSAYEEAIAHYMRALALLATLPSSLARREQEFALQFALYTPLSITRGWGGPEMRSSLARAYELSQTLGAGPQLEATLLALSTAYAGQGAIHKALAVGQELLRLAQRTQDSLSLAAAHLTIGATLFFHGELQTAREHLEQALALYDLEPSPPALLNGVDQEVTCLTWLAWVLWALGYPEQAARSRHAALARAKEMNESPTLAFALAVAGALFCILTGETGAAPCHQDALLHVVTDKDLVLYRVLGMLVEGLRRVELGQVEAGLAAIKESGVAWQAMGTQPGRVLQLVILVVAYWRAGQVEQAMSTVGQALTLVERVGLRYSEAELWRLKGELLAHGEYPDEAEVEACFQRAIAVAQQQGARLWELRAVVSLARLWQHQGRDDEARRRLMTIYGWFTEGFDIPDLTKAHALLGSVSSRAGSGTSVSVTTAAPQPKNRVAI